jgi:hypothetical protein
MTEPPIDERRFTDREIREILQRAVEKGPADALSANRGGLSLAELKAIGKEVGIDPARLEDAARAVAQRDAPGSDPIGGVPTVVRYERTVKADLDATRTAANISVIRRVMGHHGEVSEVSGSLEWRTKGGSVERLVSISSNAGTTTIEGSANLRPAAVGTFVSGGLLALTMSILGISSSVGDPTLNIGVLVLSVGFLPMALVALRSRVKKVFRSESAKLERVVNELAELIRRSGDDNPGS